MDFNAVFGMWDAELFRLGPIPVDHLVVTQWGIVAVFGLLAFFATRKMEMIPRGAQNVIEMFVEGINSFFGVMIADEKARWRVTPVLCGLFIFVLMSNYSGLLPGAGAVEGFQPPTGNWNTTLGLALCGSAAVQIIGFKQNGLHYLSRFKNPINLLEEVTHPMSLMLRLFGNIFAEETILAALLVLAPFMVPSAIMGLSLLLGAIQALVFTLLTASYLGSAASKGH